MKSLPWEDDGSKDGMSDGILKEEEDNNDGNNDEDDGDVEGDDDNDDIFITLVGVDTIWSDDNGYSIGIILVWGEG